MRIKSNISFFSGFLVLVCAGAFWQMKVSVIRKQPSIRVPATTQDYGIRPNLSPLFSSDEPLALTLEAPLKQLFAKRNGMTTEADKIRIKSEIIAGVVTHQDRTIPVEIRMRGSSTLMNCEFPKLMLNFKVQDTGGTLFAGNEKIDLGTHCMSEPNPTLGQMIFNHRESLLYRWLHILEIPGYSARSATITYIDSTDPQHKTTVIMRAFFLEHFSRFLERASGVEIRADYHPNPPPPVPRDKNDYLKLDEQPQFEREHYGKIALFQTLIGNGDWYINRNNLLNIKIVQLPTGKWLPIPLDFNLANLALGRLRPANYYEPFTALNAQTQLKFIREFEAKKSELLATLSLLVDDTVGTETFTTSLTNTFQALEAKRLELERSR